MVHRSPMNVARFALSGPKLPAIEQTLPVAEQIRRALLACYGRTAQRRAKGSLLTSDLISARSTLFSGKDESSNPLQGHQHAYYLPTDDDQDGFIDHCTIVATMGFGPSELDTMERFCHLHVRRDRVRCPANGPGGSKRVGRPIVWRVSCMGVGHPVPGQPFSQTPRSQARSGRVARAWPRAILYCCGSRRGVGPLAAVPTKAGQDAGH